MAGVFTISSCQ